MKKDTNIKIEWHGNLKKANNQDTVRVHVFQPIVEFTISSDFKLDTPLVEVKRSVRYRSASSYRPMVTEDSSGRIKNYRGAIDIDPDGVTTISVTVRNHDRIGEQKFSTNIKYDATKQVALVVGVNQYIPQKYCLNSADKDARDMANALRDIGYEEVIECVDLSVDKISDSIRRFQEEMSDCTTALFYYAGHGVCPNDSNYAMLMCNMDKDTVYLSQIMNAMCSGENSRVRRGKILIIDACREGSTLHRLTNRNQFDMLFATLPGKKAEDGQNVVGTVYNSRFTQSILDKLNESINLNFSELVSYVKEKNSSQVCDYQLHAEYDKYPTIIKR